MDWVDNPVLVYNLFEGDRDSDVTLFSNRMLVTRKPHTCVICQETIPAKTRVRAQTERDNDDRVVMTFYVCPICCDAIRACVCDGDDTRICDRTALGMESAHQAARPSEGPAGGQPPAGGEPGREAID